MVIGKKAFRTRILSESELRAFWSATAQLGYPFGPLFRMLALTGQRKSEVANARWSEFDLENDLWRIPANRMKTDALHVVPLTQKVKNLLASLPRFTNGDFLFSTNFGEAPVSGFSKAKTRLDRLMVQSLLDIEPADRPARMESFVLHDIRRTVRTGLSAVPVPDLVRELVIAHSKPGLHKVYDQFAYVEEKRLALQLWANRLESIVDPTPPGVLLLRQRA